MRPRPKVFGQPACGEVGRRAAGAPSHAVELPSHGRGHGDAHESPFRPEVNYTFVADEETVFLQVPRIKKVHRVVLFVVGRLNLVRIALPRGPRDVSLIAVNDHVLSSFSGTDEPAAAWRASRGKPTSGRHGLRRPTPGTVHRTSGQRRGRCPLGQTGFATSCAHPLGIPPPLPLELRAWQGCPRDSVSVSRVRPILSFLPSLATCAPWVKKNLWPASWRGLVLNSCGSAVML